MSAFTKTKEKHEPVKRICYRSVSKLTRCCEPIGLIYKLRSNYDFYQCTYIILRVCRSTDRIIFLQVAHKSPFSVRYWGLGVIPLMLDYFCFPRVTVSVCDIRVMAHRYFDFCQLLLVPITILFRHLIKHTVSFFLSWPSNVYIILFLALRRSRLSIVDFFLPIL